MNYAFNYPWFRVDALNSFVALAILLSSALTLIYSSKFINRTSFGATRIIAYYAYIILTALASIAAVLSNNLILLAVFWGILGLTLYLLVNMGNDAAAIAKKTFIIVGGSDALLLLGIGIIYLLSGTFQMDKISISLIPAYYPLPTIAYLSIAIACFAKAGAMPFHSWIPDCSKYAPAPIAAYLPASLDKLLGIYLLARISLDLFVMSEALNIFLMLLGALTIVAAVMMALVQHNMKRLLGCHAVSQVGYMVLGIGTGSPIGIAGGLFHMLNNSIYKQALFFVSGNVEYKTGTTELDKLGGLSKAMPFTYISCLVACLAISGVPPFNGFFSKWMVYQGLISLLRSPFSILQIVAVFCLISALFGSALTLASFMKLIHAVFLGQSSPLSHKLSTRSDAPWQMWLPCVILAAVCLIFGVFTIIPLNCFILPLFKGLDFIGSWPAGLSTLLILIGLAFGVFLFKQRALKPVIREETVFVGGETIDLAENRPTGTEFYNSLQDLRPLRAIFNKAQTGAFDIYEQGKNLTFSIGRFLQYLHNGVLPSYIVWTLLGMIGLFFALARY